MDPVATKVEDTAGAAQPLQAPPVEIEVVDTPALAPEAPAPPAAAPLFLGKYKSIEDAEEGVKNLERKMHEKAEEAATYQRMLNERAAPQPTPRYEAPPVDLDGQFREKLAENPGAVIFEAARFAAKQMLDEQQKSQRDSVRKFQQYASQPQYAAVAQQVASQLPFAGEQPIDPIEGMFLKERLRQLEAMVAGGAPARPAANPPFVLPANAANRTGAGSNRVELDADTAKLRGMSQEKVRDLARMVAKQKMAGGDMRGMSIDEWEAQDA